MSMLLLMMVLKSRQLVSQGPYGPGTYTFTIPQGVAKLTNLLGRGEAGQPESEGDWGYQLTIVYRTFRPDGTEDGGGTSVGPKVYYQDPPEANYCFTEGIGNGYTRESCYNYDTFTEYNPATTGASTSAFGKVFPGGYGGPASSQQFADVPVTPGAQYTLIVAPGGTLSFSYYK